MCADYNLPNDSDKTSKINAAGLINNTLEGLWMDAYNASAKGDFSLWNIKLDCIWAILAGDVKEGGDEEEKINKMNLKIHTIGTLKNSLGSGFNKVSNPKSSLLYIHLLNKSIYLRRLQNKQGKGTAYDDEDDYGVR